MARISDDKDIKPGKARVNYVRVQSMSRTKAGWKVNYDKVVYDKREGE